MRHMQMTEMASPAKLYKWQMVQMKVAMVLHAGMMGVFQRLLLGSAAQHLHNCSMLCGSPPDQRPLL